MAIQPVIWIRPLQAAEEFGRGEVYDLIMLQQCHLGAMRRKGCRDAGGVGEGDRNRSKKTSEEATALIPR